MSRLAKCKACGGMIAKKAKACPHCGAKNKCQPNSQALGCLIVLIFIIVGLGAFSDKKDKINNMEETLSELKEQGEDVEEFPMTSEEKERRRESIQRLSRFMNLRGEDGAIGPVRNYVIVNVEHMTNANRFLHIQTKWSPVDKDNTLFFVLMKYAVYEDFDNIKQAFLYCYFYGDVETELPQEYMDSSKSSSKSSFEKQLEYFKKKFVNKDNSVTPVVSYIKERLDKPNSFKHVETEWNNYFDNGGSTDTIFFVRMIYRATYSDNTVVTNTVVFNCSYKGKVELLYSDAYINEKEYDAAQQKRSEELKKLAEEDRKRGEEETLKRKELEEAALQEMNRRQEQVQKRRIEAEEEAKKWEEEERQREEEWRKKQEEAERNRAIEVENARKMIEEERRKSEIELEKMGKKLKEEERNRRIEEEKRKKQQQEQIEKQKKQLEKELKEAERKRKLEEEQQKKLIEQQKKLMQQELKRRQSGR